MIKSMIKSSFKLLHVSVAAAALLAGASAALAQSSGDSSPGLLDGLFGGGDRSGNGGRDRGAQVSQDLSVRVDRLEAQIRQLTGTIEELQYRNQQLTEQLQRMQQGAGYVANAAPAEGAPAGAPPVTAVRPPVPPTVATPAPPVVGVAPAAAGPGGRRADAFDPNQNPNAPGAPRTLGSIPTSGGPPGQSGPLDIHTMNGNAANGGAGNYASAQPGGQPPADTRGPQGGGAQVATLPPSDSPKDYFDLAYGYVEHKDYARAEDGFRNFLHKYPSDRMAPEAEFWLGESQFQQQHFRDAAEAFLNVSTKYESTAKAPDALLRLGTSLAALGEKEAACASLGEVMRKYPRAALGVRQGVEREQKRVGC